MGATRDARIEMIGARPGPGEALRRAKLPLDREAWLWLAFLFAVPLFLGLLLGWLRAGAAGVLSRGEAIIFILSSIMPAWLGYALATALVSRAIRRWRTPLAAKLVFGGLIGSIVSGPVLWLRRLVLDLPPVAGPEGVIPIFLMLLQYNASGMVSWLIVGLMFHHLIGLRMFGHPGLGAAPIVEAGSGFLGLQGRLPAHVRGPVLLLAASEHYLRVVTDRGEAMVLYRFGDAVAEQPTGRGAQVHRSYWIAGDAVVAVRRTAGKVAIGLKDGSEVPVSRTFLLEAKRAGLI